MTTVGELLRTGAMRLSNCSESPRLDAELLLAHVLDWSRLQLIVRDQESLDETLTARFQSLLERRAMREPIAYITGIKEFWGVNFEVTPAVLIPRPDTETLVAAAVAVIKTIAVAHSRPVRCVDFGAGSGCISVAVALECKRHGIPITILAVERSEAAAQVCLRNVIRHQVSDIIAVLCASWDSALRTQPAFDLLFSNPPYIAPEDRRLSPETAFEPQTALFAPDDGLADIRYLIACGEHLLVPGGTLLLEVGAEQAQLLRACCGSGGVVAVTAIKDLAGVERVIDVAYRR